MTLTNRLKHAFLAAACGVFLSALPAAQALEIAGVQVAETLKAGDRVLQLNGAGVRSRAVFVDYVASLYLPERKSTPAEILALPGPKVIRLHLLRGFRPEQISQMFIDGLNSNSTTAEKNKIAQQMIKLGERFQSLLELRKSDVLDLEWRPAEGTVISLNGKPTGETLTEADFYNAVLKIWLGDYPASATLKSQLLGLSEKTDPADSAKGN